MRKLRDAAMVVAMTAGVTLGWSEAALADWTWNLGYHNPANSTVGLNALYIGSDFGFEVGVGWIDLSSSEAKKDDSKTDANDKDKDDDRVGTTSLQLAGDADIRYFFTSGKFRPYLQGGFGLGFGGSVGSKSGAGMGLGGGFGGLGLLIGSPGFYAYGSYNLDGHENAFVQAGVGFDL